MVFTSKVYDNIFATNYSLYAGKISRHKGETNSVPNKSLMHLIGNSQQKLIPKRSVSSNILFLINWIMYY